MHVDYGTVKATVPTTREKDAGNFMADQSVANHMAREM